MRSPTDPDGTPMSSAATPAFQLMPTTVSLAATTKGSTRGQAQPRARTMPQAPWTSKTSAAAAASPPAAEASSPSSTGK